MVSRTQNKSIVQGLTRSRITTTTCTSRPKLAIPLRALKLVPPSRTALFPMFANRTQAYANEADEQRTVQQYREPETPAYMTKGYLVEKEKMIEELRKNTAARAAYWKYREDYEAVLTKETIDMYVVVNTRSGDRRADITQV